jgi:hypothetical protein
MDVLEFILCGDSLNMVPSFLQIKIRNLGLEILDHNLQLDQSVFKHVF